MKAITLTNSKYQYMCSKSIKSFLRFNDLPIEIYFVGSEIENTCLKLYNCHYIKSNNSKIPDDFRWYPDILKEKLKIFILQDEDFLYFDADVFFYKKIDFDLFKDGISGTPEYAYPFKDYSSYLNAGFLVFKNVHNLYNINDIDNFFNEDSDLPEEEFLYRYKEVFNFLDLNICYLNYPYKFVSDPIAVHCVGKYKPFINAFDDPIKLNHFHYNKIYELNL